MKPEIKKKWLTALRSGEYQQGKDVLKNHGKYCCLAVLSDIYQKEHEDVVWVNSGNGQALSPLSQDPQNLPSDVANWAELQRPVKVPFRGRDIRLAELNDDFGLDFNELAALIEEYL